MSFKIRLDRDWNVAHRGAPMRLYTAGTYNVPEQMPAEIAHRALRTGIAVDVSKVRQKAHRAAPENK